jgi:hypothetical protein
MTIAGGEIKYVVCASLPHCFEMTEAGFQVSLTFALNDFRQSTKWKHCP